MNLAQPCNLNLRVDSKRIFLSIYTWSSALYWWRSGLGFATSAYASMTTNEITLCIVVPTNSVAKVYARFTPTTTTQGVLYTTRMYTYSATHIFSLPLLNEDFIACVCDGSDKR